MHSKFTAVISLLVIVFTSVSCPGHVWQSDLSHSRIPDAWRCSELADKQMVKIPGFSQAWQVVERCDEFPAERVSIALVFFYFEWKQKFGDFDGSVRRALDNIMIEWSSKDRFSSAYDVTGQYIRDASVVGLALTPSVIWVKIREEKMICKTSLVHELVHIAIWAKKKTDADPDHLGPKFTGWSVEHSALIQEVNDQLCQLGV